MDGVFAINLGPLLDVISSLLFAVLSGLAVYALGRVMSWLKISEDEKVRAYLETAIQGGLNFARAKAGAYTGQISVSTKSQMVADAVNYLTERVPDALKRFGIDETAARNLILARLGAAPAKAP